MKKITLIIMILGILIISNAQIEKNELNPPAKIEEMVVAKLNKPDKPLYRYDPKYDLKNKPQLKNLHIGKPIPKYRITNNKLNPVYPSFIESPVFNEEPLSLEFTKIWNVLVMYNGESLLFAFDAFPKLGGDPYIIGGINNIIEHFYNYEHKDSVIGSVIVTSSIQGIDYLIIRKEHKDIFVQVYDKVTDEYFKNEYSFSELTNHLTEAQMSYYDKVGNKSELIITPEITEMLVPTLFSHLKSYSDEILFYDGIKDRAQLEYLHLGKPIPMYTIVNEKLTFTGCWEVPVMSEGEPFSLTHVKLDDDGQYRRVGDGYSPLAKPIHNYEHKDLIIGILKGYGWNYLIIRKDNQDIFVQIYDDATREYLKNEYSFGEILNLLKK
ncbi:MAG: hypothetical protein FWC10_04070 [Lentimicrobiaceae bacterium]|nr:hypothetical protein [Lentimicrobiaceae bacterium]